jgi:hypothetical protein
MIDESLKKIVHYLHYFFFLLLTTVPQPMATAIQMIKVITCHDDHPPKSIIYPPIINFLYYLTHNILQVRNILYLILALRLNSSNIFIKWYLKIKARAFRLLLTKNIRILRNSQFLLLLLS